jgi:hypothetical protein
MDRIDLAQDKDSFSDVVNAIMTLQAPQNAWNFLASCSALRFSVRALLR